MSFFERLTLLEKNLGSKKPIKCNRCGLYFNDEKQKYCPHCKGLSNKQVEKLQKSKEHQSFKSILHVFITLAILTIVFLLLLSIPIK